MPLFIVHSHNKSFIFVQQNFLSSENSNYVFNLLTFDFVIVKQKVLSLASGLDVGYKRNICIRVTRRKFKMVNLHIVEKL